MILLESLTVKVTDTSSGQEAHYRDIVQKDLFLHRHYSGHIAKVGDRINIYCNNETDELTYTEFPSTQYSQPQ